MTEGGQSRRRRRRRASAPQGPPPTAPEAPAAPPAPTQAKSAPSKTAKRRPRENGPERGLRDLVGAGHSLLGVGGALRGRDVNRPSEEDVAEAERDVVIVRRHWKPREES